jgi:hypothetical protein
MVLTASDFLIKWFSKNPARAAPHGSCHLPGNSDACPHGKAGFLKSFLEE